MKKLLTFIISACILTLTFSSIAFAGDLEKGEKCKESSECIDGLSCMQLGYDESSKSPIKYCVSLIEALTMRKGTGAETDNPDLKNLQALPNVSLEGGMTLAIKAMLRSAMYLTIIAIVVAAMYYIISRGKDEDMTKAKDIILYLVIGMAIIAAAYGIVSGVAQFNVFG